MAELFSQLAAAKQLRDKSLGNLNFLLSKPNTLDLNEANANLSVAQSNVDEATRRLNLLKDGPDANQLALAEAQVLQAEGNLKNSEANQSYTKITSPVDGVVIDRKIDEGQSLAAQFQTPELTTGEHVIGMRSSDANGNTGTARIVVKVP